MEGAWNLVGGDAIPNNQLAVLRCAHEMRGVAGPVHRVNLSKVAFEGSPQLRGSAQIKRGG